jgi:hypothetical protein
MSSDADVPVVMGCAKHTFIKKYWQAFNHGTIGINPPRPNGNKYHQKMFLSSQIWCSTSLSDCSMCEINAIGKAVQIKDHQGALVGR